MTTAPNRDPRRVFISSTCNDLIDLRAELAAWLQECGFEPVYSEGGDSLFSAREGENTIETCLANLRSCGTAVVILSQRYGWIARTGPYKGKSATQIEYEEAQRLQINTLFYARDRLLGEYERWQRDRQGFEPEWVDHDPEQFDGVFSLINDRKDPNRGDSRWLWPFKHCKELRGRVVQDLVALAPNVVASALLARPGSPAMTIRGTRCDAMHICAEIGNGGTGCALDVRVQLLNAHPSAAREMTVLPPGGVFPVVIPAGDKDVLRWLKGEEPPLNASRLNYAGSLEYRTTDGFVLREDVAITRGHAGIAKIVAIRKTVKETPKSYNVSKMWYPKGLMAWEQAVVEPEPF